MNIKTFHNSSWNFKIIEELEIYKFQGLEFSEFGSDEFLIKKRALKEIFERVDKIFGGFGCWVISGHEIPQHDSRIVKYKKFFASANVAVPLASLDAAEWVVPEGNGYKFFGSINKADISDDEFFRLCREFKTTWLIFSKDFADGKKIPELLSGGWEASPYFCPKNLLKIAQERNMILVRDFGPADDLCTGAVVISELKISNQIMAA